MSCTTLAPVRLLSTGVIAPGLPDWPAARRVLTGEARWSPAPLHVPPADFLPATERRRVGSTSLLALSCAMQALLAAEAAAADGRGDPIERDRIATVFASIDGDADNTHRICEALTEPLPTLSPTRFHNSVQNAASGYWSILTGSQAATTMLSGADACVAQALLEAAVQAIDGAGPVLLVVYDLPMPQPLLDRHPLAFGGALACLIGAGPGFGTMLQLSVAAAEAADRNESPSVSDGLPAGNDRAGDTTSALAPPHPLDAAVGLLRLVATGRSGHTSLRLDDYHRLVATVGAAAGGGEARRPADGAPRVAGCD